jgi:predicted  nucleic acid-binding Zn-ribbon protein
VAGAKHGIAVVPVVKGACGGCYASLPPQRVNEVRLGERVVLCDACSRILVWDEETASQ